MAREVRKDIADLLENAGYVRVSDNEAGARFVQGSDMIYVSGQMLLVRSGGMTRPFSFDRALKLGVRMMERVARLDPQKDQTPQEPDERVRPLTYDINPGGKA